MTFRAAIASMAMTAALPAHAAEPLQPSSRWQIDFGQTECIAVRQYAESDRNLHLVLKPYVVGERFEIAVIEEGKADEPLSLEGLIQADGNEAGGPAVRFGDDAAGRTVTTWYLDEMEVLSGAKQVSLHFDNQAIELALTQSAEVVDALQSCRSQLGDYYNLSGAGIVAPPSGSVDVLRDDDWPLLASDDATESVFRALLLLDEEGKVAECSLLSFAGDALFVARSCALIRERARFEPAKGADGKAMRSTFVTPAIEWRMGKEISNKRKEEFLRRDGANDARARGPGDSEGVLLRPPGG